MRRRLCVGGAGQRQRVGRVGRSSEPVMAVEADIPQPRSGVRRREAAGGHSHRFGCAERVTAWCFARNPRDFANEIAAAPKALKPATVAVMHRGEQLSLAQECVARFDRLSQFKPSH